MSGDYYDYQRELRRLQRHRETFINNIEVAKILPTLCESEAFTKRDETEVKDTSVGFKRTLVLQAPPKKIFQEITKYVIVDPPTKNILAL